MVFNVWRRLWRRARAEFDRLEAVALIQRTRSEVLHMSMQLDPLRRELLGQVDESRAPALAPFGWVDVQPVDIRPAHGEIGDDLLVKVPTQIVHFGRMIFAKTQRACSSVSACQVGR